MCNRNSQAEEGDACRSPGAGRPSANSCPACQRRPQTQQQVAHRSSSRRVDPSHPARLRLASSHWPTDPLVGCSRRAPQWRTPRMRLGSRTDHSLVWVPIRPHTRRSPSLCIVALPRRHRHLRYHRSLCSANWRCVACTASVHFLSQRMVRCCKLARRAEEPSWALLKWLPPSRAAVTPCYTSSVVAGGLRCSARYTYGLYGSSVAGEGCGRGKLLTSYFLTHAHAAMHSRLYVECGGGDSQIGSDGPCARAGTGARGRQTAKRARECETQRTLPTQPSHVLQRN